MISHVECESRGKNVMLFKAPLPHAFLRYIYYITVHLERESGQPSFDQFKFDGFILLDQIQF